MNQRGMMGAIGASFLIALAAGCGDDGGDSDAAPTATAQSTETAIPTSTPAPVATATPTSEVDIAVCAPAAGPFTTTLDNPYFPLPVGGSWILEGDEDGAVVSVVISALDETEVVAGVTTRVVEEREVEDGELIEVSRNFFVQAANGTVCYYGEDVDIYEDGEIVSHDGAWRAGGNNQPGILMPGSPRLGQSFAQEVAPGIAEDEAELVAVGETVEVPLGTFSDTLRFDEFNPLDGGSSEKVYGRGVGLLIDDELMRIVGVEAE